MIVLAIVAFLVVAKLISLQIVQSGQLGSAAEAMRTNVVKLQAKRGTIYDRKGNVLAMSQACKTIYCNPQLIKDPDAAADILAEDLGGDASSYLTTMDQSKAFAYVRRQVDKDKAERVKQDLKDARIGGFYYLDDTKRVYPYGAVGSQVLGIVGVDGAGITGLELYYNDMLSGTDGSLIMEVGNGGTPIAGEGVQLSSAKDGADIVISLDAEIQKAAEETITQGVEHYTAESGTVVASDPTTGEILAACSTPLFDVTDTSKIEDGATGLKAVSSSYEPGSIFKLLTFAIGIDEGFVTPETSFSVPPAIRVGDDLVRDDDKRSITMDMTVREILRRSSNTGTALMAQTLLGADTFAEGIARFGIGQKTGIDYPGETEGIVASRDDYGGASVGSMSFGQSLAMPAIQMVKAVGALADGGVLHTPHFLVRKNGEKVDWESPGSAVSAQTAAQMTDMMVNVVKNGTGTAAQVEGYDVAGKTGTGEQASASGGYKGYLVSSLIGFAPAHDARVLVYVGLNGTSYHGGDSAAPLFSTIMENALTNQGIRPSS